MTYDAAEITAEIDPASTNNPELVAAITFSTIPYLSSDTTTAVTHCLIDLTFDIAVIGGFNDFLISADLGRGYHSLTVGLARAAHERNIIKM